MEIFKIENLTYYYPQTKAPALSNISLTINEGDFFLLVGPSGSGKSTLARAIAGFIPDFYGGKIKGHVYFKGKSLRNLVRRELSKEIGMVFQNPERQLIMNTVEREIIFGCENLGMPTNVIKRQLTEVLNFLNIQPIRHRQCDTLSGGEKQRVVLASILAMNPRVLMLDEPTSQLDPVAAQELFEILRRINEELGCTVVLIEQRLDKCFYLADKVGFMLDKKLIVNEETRKFCRWAKEWGVNSIPMVSQLFDSDRFNTLAPLNIKEGREILRKIGNLNCNLDFPAKSANSEVALELKNLFFAYNENEVINNINLQVKKGEFLCILGENGAGKTSLLKLICGINSPIKGKITIFGKKISEVKGKDLPKIIGYLSQDPNDYLFNDTVLDEVSYALKNLNISDSKIISDILDFMDLKMYKDVNPRDLSTGERLRVALASIMTAGPDIYLLDEPTRGLDQDLKSIIGRRLKNLTEEGKVVLLVTQDVDFAAEFADRVVLLFNGEIVADGNKKDIFKGDLFYSPTMNRLFHRIVPEVVNFKEAKQVLS